MRKSGNCKQNKQVRSNMLSAEKVSHGMSSGLAPIFEKIVCQITIESPKFSQVLKFSLNVSSRINISHRSQHTCSQMISRKLKKQRSFSSPNICNMFALANDANRSWGGNIETSMNRDSGFFTHGSDILSQKIIRKGSESRWLKS